MTPGCLSVPPLRRGVQIGTQYKMETPILLIASRIPPGGGWMDLNDEFRGIFVRVEGWMSNDNSGAALGGVGG